MFSVDVLPAFLKRGVGGLLCDLGVSNNDYKLYFILLNCTNNLDLK